MKKSFLTKMPDKAGAFYKASEIIYKNKGNIVRVNYNRNIDLHTLFIDVSATADDMHKIDIELTQLGYLHCLDEDKKVLLISLKLLDEPGTIKPILELLSQYDINISYMNSQENETGYQHFKMGLYIADSSITKEVLDKISRICELSIIDYSVSDKILDNTVFYLEFGNKMRKLLKLSQNQTNQFLINSNKILQMLDENNNPPYKTFEYIQKFAEFVVKYSGENFKPRIDKKQLSPQVEAYIIEPPCGSNTYILKAENKLLFVDCGFPCFENEMNKTIEELIPNYENYEKELILTHGDLDHAGLINKFSKVWLNASCYENFLLQSKNKDDFRELNVKHNPYSKLSKIISKYQKPNMDNMHVIGKKNDDKILSYIGGHDFMDMHFDVYQGIGGHIAGESIIVCNEHKVTFTGDNYVNIKGFSKEQREFNQLAPYLMTSVDSDPQTAMQVRKEVLKLCKNHLRCPGHGMWEE